MLRGSPGKLSAVAFALGKLIGIRKPHVVQHTLDGSKLIYGSGAARNRVYYKMQFIHIHLHINDPH